MTLKYIIRGFYYLFFCSAKGFRKTEKELKAKYYSTSFTEKKNIKTTVIVMVDGRAIHGGLTDRLRGITSIYHYCCKQNVEFRLNYNYPFKLSDYLELRNKKWYIAAEDISYNSRESVPVMLNDYQLDTRLHRFYLAKRIHDYQGMQIHLYTNTYFNDNHFSEDFHQLFRPSIKLQIAMDEKMKHIGNSYIAMVFRFQQLLGDFKEIGYKTLSDTEQQKLIHKCLAKIMELHDKYHIDKSILITSDSTTFLNIVSTQLPFAKIIPGKVVHMDHTANANFETYMKSFEDLFALSNAEKIYLMQTGDMYHSGFAKRAAMINNRPYEEILF